MLKCFIIALFLLIFVGKDNLSLIAQKSRKNINDVLNDKKTK